MVVRSGFESSAFTSDTARGLRTGAGGGGWVKLVMPRGPETSPSDFKHVCDVRNELVQLQSLELTVSLLRVRADSWLSVPGILLLSTSVSQSHTHTRIHAVH